MEDFQIVIQVKKKIPTRGQQVVKITEEAYNALVEIYNESSMNIKQIASLLIMEAAKHVKYEKED